MKLQQLVKSLTPEEKHELLDLLLTEEIIAEIDDTSAFGISHHNHSQHRVYISELNYAQAKYLRDTLNNGILLTKTFKTLK